MTRIASRADLHYIIAFLAGLLSITVSSFVIMLLTQLAPWITPNTTLEELQTIIQLEVTTAMAAGLLMYAGGFLVLAAGLGRWGARITGSRVIAGAVIATALTAAMALTSYALSYVPTYTTFDPSDWWQPAALFLAPGAFYVIGWWIATAGALPKPNTLKKG
jgi:hypothetical protein